MLPKPWYPRRSGDRGRQADERRCGAIDDNVIVAYKDGRSPAVRAPMQVKRKEPRTTKCAICRQPSVPGERLCAPCKSALKRARDTTVSEAILPTRRARRRPERIDANVASPPAGDAPGAPMSTATRVGWARRAVAGTAALAALAVIAGWLAHTGGPDRPISPRHSLGAAEASTETVTAAASPDVRAAASPAAPVVANAAPVSIERAPDRPPIDPRTLPASIAVPRAPAAPAPEPVSPAGNPRPGRGTATDPALGAFPPAPPPQPVIVAQAPAPKPAPDRWQRLADALARCPANDVIARTVCQETLRLEQCEGYWGRVAPCPARPERDYGN